MLGKLLLPEIEELIQQREFQLLKTQLADLPEADIAEIIGDIEEGQVPVVFRLLSKEKATDVFEHLDFEEQEILLKSLSLERIKQILAEMSVDDRTALFDEVPSEVASQLIELLSVEDRELARTILNYPEDSVGRLMTPDYVALSPEMTVQQALDRIRRFGQDKETVYACYVTGPRRKLLGIVTLRLLVVSPLDSTIDDIYTRQFVHLNTDTPQEEAVDTFRHYDLIALPVLDKSGQMIGIVTFDDIMDVAEEEFREDMDMMAAVVPSVSDREFLDEKLFSVVGRRIPWLIALLIVEAFAVLVLQSYDRIFEQFIALSFFLPALIATGGNTGTQSASMVIRALAMGEVELSDLGKIFVRGIFSGVVLAIVLGTCAYLLAFLMGYDPMIGLCVSSGLATVVVLSNLAGSILPLILKRAGLDPALMSSPFISTLVDIFGLVIYLEISKRILGL